MNEEEGMLGMEFWGKTKKIVKRRRQGDGGTVRLRFSTGIKKNQEKCRGEGEQWSGYRKKTYE